MISLLMKAQITLLGRDVRVLEQESSFLEAAQFQGHVPGSSSRLR